MIRIGNGFDIHAFAEERPLILGGVRIAHARGLQGHSDADVLTHAVCDALLGALALGDIGHFFPDTDSAHKDADSLDLLKQVYGFVRQRSASIINMDTVLVIEQPKLAPYINAMRKNMAECLDCRVEQISIKATTGEKLGFIGREEGVAAYTVVLLECAGEK